MRVLNFTELLAEYKFQGGIDADDLKEREQYLEQFSFSVITECEWSEYESLEKWAEQHIDEFPVPEIGYGKTGYNFGCFEYFFHKKENADNFARTVPLIYTTYPHSYPLNKILKTHGYDTSIEYDPGDSTAIVY